jgi:hypothetical protein
MTYLRRLYLATDKEINTNKFNLYVDLSCGTNGFYIECNTNNVNFELINIYKFEESKIIKIDNIKVEKINEKILYLSFENYHYDNDLDKFNFRKNRFPRIETSKYNFLITFDFFNIENNIKIFFLLNNIFKYTYGMCALSNIFYNDEFDVTITQYIELLYDNYKLHDKIFEGKTLFLTDKHININNLEHNFNNSLLSIKALNYNLSNINTPLNTKNIDLYSQKDEDYKNIKIPLNCTFKHHTDKFYFKMISTILD